jgi:hypothetical protein
MTSKTKSILLAVSVVVAGTVGGLASSRSAIAGSGCKNVSGNFTATVTITNCTSPIGLCLQGTITGDPLLNGTVNWTIVDEAPSAGMPATQPSAAVSFDGTISIDAGKGDTLQLSDVGVYQGFNANPFADVETVQQGTGQFATATGQLWFTGLATNNGNTLSGALTGQICGL